MLSLPASFSKALTCCAVRQRSLTFIAFVVFGILGAAPTVQAQQTIVHVDRVDGLVTPAGPNPGDSWTNAYRYLQDGINHADSLSGQTQVRVRGFTGTLNPALHYYYPDEGAGLTPDTRDYRFNLRNSVSILGGYIGGTGGDANDRSPAYITVLSGDIDGDGLLDADNSYHVIGAASTLAINGNLSPHLDGATIRSGVADTTFAVAAGGGMFVEGGGDPYLRGCTITANKADRGGAISCGGLGTGEVILRNCIVSSNTATLGDGGGIYADGANTSITLLNTSVLDNSSPIRGGGVYTNDAAEITIISCTISGNTSTSDGGGARLGGANDALVITNSLFTSNTSGALGGGLWCKTASTVTNCTFNGNSASTGGGAILNEGPMTLVNSICWANNSTSGATEIANISGQSLVATNCDIRDRNGNGVSGSFSFSACIGENLTAHNPNFTSAPTNCRLLCPSPCVNTGLNSSVPDDEEDVDEDTDDDEDTPDRDLLTRIAGSIPPGSAVVDMGAYEKQITCCPANIIDTGNSFCRVDVDDLLAVISNWGTCTTCVGDVAPLPCGNGDVNVDDLLTVVVNWGQCTGCACEPTGGEDELPQSVSDCMNLCSGQTGQNYANCMSRCFAVLCQQGHTEYCD